MCVVGMRTAAIRSRSPSKIAISSARADMVKLAANVKEDAVTTQDVVLTNLTKEVKVEKLGKYVKTRSDVSGEGC